MSDTPIIPESSRHRIVVVGAGAAGLACAWRLAGAGHAVTLIEAGEPGEGAMKASGGMLAAGYECTVELEEGRPLAEAFARLTEAAAELWPAWADRLQQESGRAVGYERRGSLLPIFSADESVRAAACAERARELGVRIERLDGEGVRNAEPSLAAALGGIAFPGDGQVDNRALGQALAEAASARGVKIISRRKVQALDRRAGAVAGVILDPDERIAADAVILATGVASLPDLPRQMAMTPVKGQMIAFAAQRPLAPSRIIRGFSIYLAAKPGMRLVAGATSEPDACDNVTDDEAVARLTAAARAAIPGLCAVPVMDRWAGVRPRSADSLPVIGELEPGLFAAGGGYRNGVLLAPAIAEALTAMIGKGEAWPAAAPFTPDRAGLAR